MQLRTDSTTTPTIPAVDPRIAPHDPKIIARTSENYTGVSDYYSRASEHYSDHAEHYSAHSAINLVITDNGTREKLTTQNYAIMNTITEVRADLRDCD